MHYSKHLEENPNGLRICTAENGLCSDLTSAFKHGWAEHMDFPFASGFSLTCVPPYEIPVHKNRTHLTAHSDEVTVMASLKDPLSHK